MTYHLLKDFADLTRREESRVRNTLVSFDDDHDDRLTQLQFRRALQTLGLNLRERVQVRRHAHDRAPCAYSSLQWIVLPVLSPGTSDAPWKANRE